MEHQLSSIVAHSVYPKTNILFQFKKINKFIIISFLIIKKFLEVDLIGSYLGLIGPLVCKLTC